MTNPIDTAWKIHAAIIDWTGKVDTKASFTLTIESAVMAGIVTLSGGGRALYDLRGWHMVLYTIGVSLLTVAILCSAFVVIPRLRRTKHLKTEAAGGDFVYFGHLRHLTSDTIEDLLKTSDMLTVLSSQLQRTSEIAWLKHRLVQFSMTIAVIGVTCVAVAGLF